MKNEIYAQIGTFILGQYNICALYEMYYRQKMDKIKQRL